MIKTPLQRIEEFLARKEMAKKFNDDWIAANYFEARSIILEAALKYMIKSRHPWDDELLAIANIIDGDEK